MPTIRRRLAEHEPDAGRDADTDGARFAATALILHAADAGPEVLLIRRTERRGDPWSGHVALPGGRREPRDRDLAATAAREAREEVGVALPAPLGRIDDVAGRTHGGGVATYVFEVPDRPRLVRQRTEVARTYWVGLAALTEEEARTRHPVPGLGPFPGIRIGDDVLWGLTLRTMENFFGAIGARLR